MQLAFRQDIGLDFRYIIARVTGRPVHVALLFGDRAYEADTSGVRCLATTALLATGDWSFERVPDYVDAARCEEFLSRQLGKKYDWMGALVAWWFGKPAGNGHKDKWFCSELAAATLDAGGYILRCQRYAFYTPRELFDEVGGRMSATPRPDIFMRALILAALFVCAMSLFAQPAPKPRKFTSCDPIHVLRTSPNKRDTLLKFAPCRSLDKLDPAFRVRVECTLGKMAKGKWPVRITETWRSQELQGHYYGSGRTRSGPIVTKVKDATLGMHNYGWGLDGTDAEHGWEHDEFFYWWGIHAESCGLVAGRFWKTLPDGPHLQLTYAGRPPQWAIDMKRAGKSNPEIWREKVRRDSLAKALKVAGKPNDSVWAEQRRRQ